MAGQGRGGRTRRGANGFGEAPQRGPGGAAGSRRVLQVDVAGDLGRRAGGGCGAPGTVVQTRLVAGDRRREAGRRISGCASGRRDGYATVKRVLLRLPRGWV